MRGKEKNQRLNKKRVGESPRNWSGIRGGKCASTPKGQKPETKKSRAKKVRDANDLNSERPGLEERRNSRDSTLRQWGEKESTLGKKGGDDVKQGGRSRSKTTEKGDIGTTRKSIE